MKTALKIVGILIVLIIALAILLPIIFKGKIIELAKKEINKSVAAKVDFSDVGMSLLRSFPDFSLRINNLTVVGINEFEKDTLANIEKLELTLDLMSVISGNNYEIKKIRIYHPDINVRVLKDGKTNYDISLPEEEQPVTTKEEEQPFKLTLKLVEIEDANIVYDDASLPTKAVLKGLNHQLSGNMDGDFTTLKTTTTIDKFDLDYDGVRYFSNANVDYKADIDADLKNEVYNLKENELKLNELFLAFAGSFAFVGEDYKLDFTFNAPKTDFKNFLSVVPAIYAKDFASVETKGNLKLDGMVKGLYTETSLPAFNLNLLVSDAMFKYPDLPKAVTGINIKTAISNPGGDADNTVIDISDFKMQLGNDLLEMKMLIKTPVSDPDIDANIKGSFNLAGVSEYYPLEKGDELTGLFIFDIILKGKLSAVENEQYENFTALGSLKVKEFKYTSSMVNEPVEIALAQLDFSPAYLELVSFQSKIGKNDFNAQGKLTNYLAYAFRDEILKGNLKTTSHYFDISSLMPEETGTTQESSVDTTAMTVVEIPGNIDFEMAATFDKLIYDNIIMDNVKGMLKVKDKKLELTNLSMNLLKGEMVMNGVYSTVTPDKPDFDFGLNMKNIDIQEAYKTLEILSTYAPIAQKTSGLLSAKMNLKSNLDKEMSPVYESMTGGGEFSTSPIKVSGVNTLDKIADALKMDNLRSLDISKILVQFEFIDGKIMVKPFDMKVSDYTAKLGGWTAFDQTIDYVMNLNVPRKEFGSAANNVLNNLVSQANSKGANFSLGEMVSLDVLIGGTLTDPTIKTGLKDAGKNLMEDVKEQVKQEVEKKVEEVKEDAKAQAQKLIDDANKSAQMLISEAEKQADNIRKTAADGAKKLRDEADVQAKKVEAEGKKNGFLAEAAAKESAKGIRKEADKKATSLTTEADKQANSVVSKAKAEADAIKKQAQDEADKLLGK
jgi:cell division septum initiation protein DivIVA